MSVTRNSLCARCLLLCTAKPGYPAVILSKEWKVVESPPEVYPNFMHYNAFTEFENSAQSHCHLCRLFFDQVPLDTIPLLRDPTPEYGRIGLVYARAQFVSEFDVNLWYPYSARARKIQNDLGFRMTLHLVKKGSDEYEVSSGSLPLESSNNTESSKSIHTALEWIRECDNDHELCTKHTRPDILPARLIDVGVATGYSDICLCPTYNLGEDVLYIALSHCWGKKPLLKLEKCNLTDFEIQIPWQWLSKTFQDAIKMVKILREEYNVRYIWIDSLCIIQDSSEDWRTESTKMAHVYKNAFCVLAATGGIDGTSGMFFHRDPISLNSLELTAQFEGLSKETYICENRRCFDTSISNSPLLRRAWVVQERSLARRIIHFTHNQLYWECVTKDCSEAYPKKLLRAPNPVGKNWSAFDFKPKRLFGDHYDKARIKYEIYNIWDKVKFHYTAAKLTHDSDKLIAISGIAREMQAFLIGTDSYVAGLWKRFIVLELLWTVRPGKLNSRQRQYRAPTWSWASVDAGLHLGGNSATNTDEVVVTISSITVKTVRDDPFLHVESGSLVAMGSLVKVLLAPQKMSGGAVHLFLRSSHESLGNGTMDMDLGLSNDNKDLALCMPFLVRHSQAELSYMKGLLLKPLLEHVEGNYERCGVFEVFGVTCCKLLAVAAKVERLTKDEYKDFDGQSSQYSILIV